MFKQISLELVLFPDFWVSNILDASVLLPAFLFDKGRLYISCHIIVVLIHVAETLSEAARILPYFSYKFNDLRFISMQIFSMFTKIDI